MILARLGFGLVALLAGGCGYRLAHGAADPIGPLAVQGAAVIVPAAAAVAAVEAGARAELSRSGQLAGCDPARCPALVVEVLRVDEEGAAVGVGGQGAPLGRGVTFSVTGRAYVRRAPSAAPERDTGDVTVREGVARQDEPLGMEFSREEALQRAAHRLGETLVRRALTGF
ncbi:hypothetical protein [Polyangium aurulentum]|uniref:hypothetical protein n=1 Tax=Polyangium aurulentum TaxID=2567896 RepID=UPI00146BE56B|nr:hypothetical protein [Polyangium aurulentum]UQA56422.1 hypothetical protein E8A73_034675 [Polyangium aurulentum]